MIDVSEWNEDPEFAELPYERKRNILQNYFDSELADDGFTSLRPDDQDLAREFFYASNIGKPKKGIIINQQNDELLDRLVSEYDKMKMEMAKNQVAKANENIRTSLEDYPKLGERSEGQQSNMPSYDTIKQFTDKKSPPAEVEPEGPNSSPPMDVEGESTTAASTEGGPTLGGAATVLGIIKAADAVRQDQGQLDRPYEKRGAFAKAASAPVMGGPPALLKAAGVGDSNYFSKVTAGLAKGEEKMVGGPLDKAFAGDIGGSFKDFGNSIKDFPEDLWGWIKTMAGK